MSDSVLRAKSAKALNGKLTYGEAGSAEEPIIYEPSKAKPYAVTMLRELMRVRCPPLPRTAPPRSACPLDAGAPPLLFALGHCFCGRVNFVVSRGARVWRTLLPIRRGGASLPLPRIVVVG